MLSEAVEAGGSTLRDYAQTDGSLGYFQHRFRVYDREGERCATEGCGATVRRLVQSGRSTFYCPRCQRRRSPVARTGIPGLAQRCRSDSREGRPWLTKPSWSRPAARSGS